ncbi:MAG: MATE family efflux transporter, partial [Acidimicrobiia bacterium]
MASNRRWDREIARLAVPGLGALVAEPLYILTDTAVVGHLGTPQLGGLAVAGTVLTTAFWLFNFLAYGTTGAVARHYGAGNRRAAAAHSVQAAWIAIGIGILLTLAGVLAGRTAVGLMGASEEVAGHALVYLRISAFGAPAVLLMLVGAGLMRGLQDTKTTLVVAVGSNLINLVVEVVLIYAFGYGIGASALATVIAQWAGAGVYLAILIRQVRGSGASLLPGTDGIGRMFSAGGALFVRTGSLLAALAVATSVASRLGTTSVAAHQIAFQLWSLLALVLDALAIAAQAMVGRMLGAGDARSARAVSHRLLRIGGAIGLGTAGVVFVVSPFVGRIFTSDPVVLDELRVLLLVVALMQPINAAVFVLDGVLIGASDFRYLAVAMVASTAVFLPLAIGVLLADLSLVWLWAALGVLMLTRLAGV